VDRLRQRRQGAGAGARVSYQLRLFRWHARRASSRCGATASRAGVTALAARMIADSGARGAERARGGAGTGSDGFVARTQDGRRFVAKRRSSPPASIPWPVSASRRRYRKTRPPRIAAAISARAVKVWPRPPASASAFSRPAAATASNGCSRAPGVRRRAMIVGFASPSPASIPARPGDVERAWRASSGARLLAFDWHDWIADPFARGAWVASGSAPKAMSRPRPRRGTGRLAFASSDFASTGAGWFDAAALSGAQAAQEILQLLRLN